MKAKHSHVDKKDSYIIKKEELKANGPSHSNKLEPKLEAKLPTPVEKKEKKNKKKDVQVE